MVKISNCFDFQKEDHEKWFEYCYLFSLGLRNKKIDKNDFEGIICDKDDKEIALFELKLVTLSSVQEITKRILELEEGQERLKYLEPMPKYEEIKKRLRDIVAEATNQVLNKEKNKSIARIVFIIRNTIDFNEEDLIDAIKSNRMIIIDNKKFSFNKYGCQNENEEALDLFYDKNLSGLICLTIEYKDSYYSYSSIIIKNKDALISLPNIFMRNAEFVDEI